MNFQGGKTKGSEVDNAVSTSDPFVSPELSRSGARRLAGQECYVQWIIRYFRFFGVKYPNPMGTSENKTNAAPLVGPGAGKQSRAYLVCNRSAAQTQSRLRKVADHDTRAT